MTMDPISLMIATELARGFITIGKKLFEKGIDIALEPGQELLRERLQRSYRQQQQDKNLQKAVQQAFQAIGAPALQKADAYERFLLNYGFDQLQAKDNEPLREELARTVLLMTSSKLQLVPDALWRGLRWPSDNRQVLANFLFALRGYLRFHEIWGPLIEQSDRLDVQRQLHELNIGQTRSIEVMEQIASYMRAQWLNRGLDPSLEDAQALHTYIEHVIQAYDRLSFLFIRPTGRRDRMITEASLEMIFVPLYVVDDQNSYQLEFGKENPHRNLLIDIKEVLNQYPIFLLRGLPGSGKTTLLRHLALAFAFGQATRLDWTELPLLPILVPLRNFGRFLVAHPEYSNLAPRALGAFIEDYFSEHELTLPPDFFRRRLAEGGCLVLLDGLDEVADRDLRVTVAQMVNAFISHHSRSGNRFGLASRPRGYDEVATYLPRVTVCDVQPLRLSDRDQLVINLLEELGGKGKQFKQEVTDLLADIRSKSKVDELSRNPLYCTTLILVYKYRGAALPERRVDIYHELVELMLGFWEAHKAEREGLADVQDLARFDGTGRVFRDERHAVEAKRRALTHIADWMQLTGLVEVPRTDVMAHLGSYFHHREGATLEEMVTWADGFLDVSHQRSGLFVEIAPEIYGFAHKNFLEYLAATALIGRLDEEMTQLIINNAQDEWWEEVILLAVAHPNLSDQRREFVIRKLLGAKYWLLAGRGAIDAGDRLVAPLRREIEPLLYVQMTDVNRTPKLRYEAGFVLDSLGWLPEDINSWVLCPGCANDGRDLWVMKYPVVNAQFSQFMAAGGYEHPIYWNGSNSVSWQWRLEEHNTNWRGPGPVTEPEYWRDFRFGKTRLGYPIVGVSWYEAIAYATWLAEVFEKVRHNDPILTGKARVLVEDLIGIEIQQIGLLEETEWVNIAGGDNEGRFPWDSPWEPATSGQNVILARTNIEESSIGNTSPVAMYPLGISKPFGLMDLAGNVWEWTNTPTVGGKARGLRGGSWNYIIGDARVVARNDYLVGSSNLNVGFRLVAHVKPNS